MHSNYEDIKSRIAEPPSWYDQHGTPRYGAFSPDMCPNIYSHHVGLFVIACQSCDLRFHVEMHDNYFSEYGPPNTWHYGDPPIHGCVGDTMNCEDLEILEFWAREGVGDWQRLSVFEGKIE